jgi:tyrosyl-tRNA synthetase
MSKKTTIADVMIAQGLVKTTTEARLMAAREFVFIHDEKIWDVDATRDDQIEVELRRPTAQFYVTVKDD